MITAGTMTTAEYINPIRYTLSRREAMMQRTGMGIASKRSLSFARYKLE